MAKKYLIGSMAKDAFLQWRKIRLPKGFYAIDVDLCLIRRAPFDLVAVIDFKSKGENDSIGFSHIVLYNWFIKNGIPVFIVWALWNKQIGDKCAFSQIDIQQYLDGNPLPDDTPYRTTTILTDGSEKDFLEWERRIRRNYTEYPESKMIDQILSALFLCHKEALFYGLDNPFDLSGEIGQIIQKVYDLRQMISKQ